MHKVIAAFLILTASVAHADDALVRKALAHPHDAKRAHVLLRVDGAVSLAPGGAALFTWKDVYPVDAQVIDRKDTARLVLLDVDGAQLAVWIAEDQLARAVVREAGVAADEKSAAPGPADDGFFVEPGQPIDGAPKGDRAHVKVDTYAEPIDGWIDAAATGLEFTPDTLAGSGWKNPHDVTTISAGGHVLETANYGSKVRALAKGRGELGAPGWRARGALKVEKPEAGPAGTRDAAHHSVAAVSATAVKLPDGACLYDVASGALVGAITATSTTYGKVVGDHLELNVFPPSTSLPMRTHGLGKAIERCAR